MDSPVIRPIRDSDNADLARIIRNALREFLLNLQGTAYEDQSIDALSLHFQEPRSAYFVACLGDRIAGGAGIRELAGGDTTIAELQKMYLQPQARGKGLGVLLLNQCLDFARQSGFKQCYIETMPELQAAIRLYTSFGFSPLSGPLGNTGHYGCRVWMIRDL
ncbi:MAG TPA: GNAT family N-acetyltransferase [Chitinophagaceae bacterium]|nr:GNAT family N-acetyltransferase [Chitinophagaceae bacterium]